MSAAAAMELRKALRLALLDDIALSGKLGGSGRIYDEAPPQASVPYIVLGDIRVRDWSTATDTGSEHIIVLEIWSGHHGVHDCMEIAALVEAVLDAATIGLPGHNLVLLRSDSIETGRRDRGRLTMARLRLRALID
jgi:hypothetical protein